MTAQEIFSQLTKHMVEGLMIHSQLSDYYYFLGLEGYGMCHEYHYYSENVNYKNTAKFFMNHYHMFVSELRTDIPEIIPETWYQHVSEDVSYETRKAYIQKGIEKWVEWESDTKKFYQEMYQELMGAGEAACAAYVLDLIQDVSEELAYAKHKHLTLLAHNYDMPTIMAEQEAIYKKCHKKLKEIKYD